MDIEKISLVFEDDSKIVKSTIEDDKNLRDLVHQVVVGEHVEESDDIFGIELAFDTPLTAARTVHFRRGLELDKGEKTEEEQDTRKKSQQIRLTTSSDSSIAPRLLSESMRSRSLKMKPGEMGKKLKDRKSLMKKSRSNKDLVMTPEKYKSPTKGKIKTKFKTEDELEGGPPPPKYIPLGPPEENLKQNELEGPPPPKYIPEGPSNTEVFGDSSPKEFFSSLEQDTTNDLLDFIDNPKSNAAILKFRPEAQEEVNPGGDKSGEDTESLSENNYRRSISDKKKFDTISKKSGIKSLGKSFGSPSKVNQVNVQNLSGNTSPQGTGSLSTSVGACHVTCLESGVIPIELPSTSPEATPSVPFKKLSLVALDASVLKFNSEKIKSVTDKVTDTPKSRPSRTTSTPKKHKEETEEKVVEVTGVEAEVTKRGKMRSRKNIVKHLTAGKSAKQSVTEKGDEEKSSLFSIYDIVKEEKDDDSTIDCTFFEQLIDELLRDPSSAKSSVFFITYQSICTPIAFFIAITDRFKNSSEDSVREGALTTLGYWMDQFDTNFLRTSEVPVELDRFLDYIDEVIGPQFARATYDLREKKEFLESRMIPETIIPATTGITKPVFHLLDFDSQDIVRQLTLTESKLFSAISPWELINQSWIKTPHKAPNVERFANWFNQVSAWVKYAILTESVLKKRIRVTEKFIEICEGLRQLNNLNGVFEISSALASAAILRLKNTFEPIYKGNKSALQQKSQEITQQPIKLRELVQSANCPIVPYIGLSLTDLTQIDEGNPDTCDGQINFTKRKLMAKTIARLLGCQQYPYKLQPNSTLQEWLEEEVKEASKFQEDTFYSFSMWLEPRPGTTTPEVPPALGEILNRKQQLKEGKVQPQIFVLRFSDQEKKTLQYIPTAVLKPHVSKACNKKGGVLEDYDIHDENGQLVLLLNQTMDCFANRTIILTAKPKSDESTDESKSDRFEKESDHVSNFSDLKEKEEQRRRKETLRTPPKFANTGKHRQEAAERRRTSQMLDNYDSALDMESSTESELTRPEDPGNELDERSNQGILSEIPEYTGVFGMEGLEIIGRSPETNRIRGSRRRWSIAKKSTEQLVPISFVSTNNLRSGSETEIISKSLSESGIIPASKSLPGSMFKFDLDSRIEIQFPISQSSSSEVVVIDNSGRISDRGKSELELEEISDAPPNEESEQSSEELAPLSLLAEKINLMYNEKRSSIQGVFDIFRVEIRHMNDLVDKVQQEAYAELKHKRDLAMVEVEDITQNSPNAPPQDWLLPSNNYLKKVALLEETINLLKVQISNFNDNSK